MTQAELDLMMENEPDLSSYGMDTELNPSYVQNRIWLAQSLDIVNDCIVWLQANYDKFERNIDSYTLKHRMEKDIINRVKYVNYIGSGQIVAAIFYLKYPYKIFRPNVLIKLSRKYKES